MLIKKLILVIKVVELNFVCVFILCTCIVSFIMFLFPSRLKLVNCFPQLLKTNELFSHSILKVLFNVTVRPSLHDESTFFSN